MKCNLNIHVSSFGSPMLLFRDPKNSFLGVQIQRYYNLKFLVFDGAALKLINGP